MQRHAGAAIGETPPRHVPVYLTVGVGGEARGQATRGRDPLLHSMGGDEFAILLPEADLPEAVQALESIRAFVAEGPESAGHRVTLSIGAVMAGPEYKGDVETLIRTADDLMYAVKRTGKDALRAIAILDAESGVAT
jgi:diguanylate cyclase (GGDEF)-like protein